MIPQSEVKNFAHVIELNNLGIRVYSSVDEQTLVNVFGGSSWIAALIGKPYPVKESDETDASFTSRQNVWKQEFVADMVYAENIVYPDNDQRQLRKLFRNEPIFNGASNGVDSDNFDFNKSDKGGPGSITTTKRTRTYNEAPVAGYMAIAAQTISRDRNARMHINSYAASGMKIPLVLNEHLKSIRESVCMRSRIKPGVQDFFTVDQLKALGLEKTIFDVKWLITQEGVYAFMDLCSRICNHPNNYIKALSFESPINFISGFTTTFTSMSCYGDLSATNPYLVDIDTLGGNRRSFPNTDQHFTGPKYVNLLPGNSYGETVNATHLMEAHVFNIKLVDTKGNPFSFNVHSPNLVLQYGNTNALEFIVKLGAGDVHNYVRKTKKVKDTPIEGNLKAEGTDQLSDVPSETNASASPGAKAAPRGSNSSRKVTAKAFTYRNSSELHSPLYKRLNSVVTNILYGMFRSGILK